jgi:hypothetical protein
MKGALASGAILEIECPECGLELRAYHNVWDEDGNMPPEPLPLNLDWSVVNRDSHAT